MAKPQVSPRPDVLRTTGWADYALVDSGDGRKLERYGPLLIDRPEPQCLWRRRDPGAWAKAAATFDPQGDEDEGRWRQSGQVPGVWPLSWRDVRFHARLTPFRHLAFFPEQAANWEWITARIADGRRPKILNLFGYTGVASLAAAAAGAEVTHVDASKKAIAWARENAALSGLEDRPIRWICEDARRYVQRELRRGVRYDGIILDPPKYGRGPGGEVWRLFEDLPAIAADCANLLAENADFLLMNAYAERITGASMAGLLAETLDGRGGQIDWGELTLVEETGDRQVGLSFFARWSAPR